MVAMLMCDLRQNRVSQSRMLVQREHLSEHSSGMNSQNDAGIY
jgi:hypothetical protein